MATARPEDADAEGKDRVIVGIDLGSSHSLVSAWIDGAPRLIPNGAGEVLTPSCVGVGDDGRILVGKAALARRATHPWDTATRFRRHLGHPHAVRLGTRDYRPEELVALVLRTLVRDAEAFLGAPVTEAVVTVPACFSGEQREATRAACELAGIKVERLLSEATAAALAHAVDLVTDEARFLVFRLGAATFDVAVAQLTDGMIGVRASAGDDSLGGDDFTALIATQAFANGLPDTAGESVAFMRELLALAETAKCELTRRGTAHLEAAYGETSVGVALDGDTFATLTQPLLNRLWYPIERAMRLARIRAADLDHVILAGGATRMPVIRALATQMFAREPTTTIDPMHIAAIGAAVQAGIAMGDRALRGLDVLEAGSRASPTVASSSTATSVTSSSDPTLDLALGFAADVGKQPVTAVQGLLANALAELRKRYIDAPGQFEEHLIDLLVTQRIGQRVAVFEAAADAFHWRLADHLDALGSRGDWIRRVLTEGDDWLALNERRRFEWLDLAALGEAGLDAPLVPRWPEMRIMRERFPTLIGLFVSTGTLANWEAAFDALPASSRDRPKRVAPDAESRLSTAAAAADRDRRRKAWRAAVLIAVALALCAFALWHGALRR